jgi:hypothetical protein
MAQQQLEGALQPKTPLEYLLEWMRDESYPPGFRLEATKAALPFCHAKKAEEPAEQVQQITKIERVIVCPKNDTDEVSHGALFSRALPSGFHPPSIGARQGPDGSA